ncbi:amino acid adenylation domain-containing protein [Pseudoalteromonas luteoviolacea]|uniref:AMP-dependent synthetase/ligase domain-containing protein n=1 Tax=Pseudoalteromonas luteoviolacea H33 TaxID=1365251 RepID=A0A166ZQQ2_9GAMM|nr:amino acid adenylation domain-containing protein [Pseudoalteromonas luteoviolacea]KZN44560.1 hypothetical protein N476_06055 [Pseudoalteromonas luteoviolacea H33]KZN75362.1 hypothetical protein N477_19065 [Pseudoalteromonas luteoviolacea H33-S]MBQ4879581.1 amino acid adenylation domain-containing protein [Pseudoalteromonas luteoviolacea]MBQ4908714.1 amino acid adenylation domain-containing protein [Pseudoalteromonas luteoviolacea]
MTVNKQTEASVLLAQVNDTYVEFDRQISIAQAFNKQAKRTPHAIALEWRDVKVTYGELERQANQLANVLKMRGHEQDTSIAFSLNKSPRMVVAMLAILKLGSAYLPLDSNLPIKRQQSMIYQSRTRLVLCENSKVEALPLPVHFINLEDIDAECQFADASEPEVAHREMAYINFTSGSTGEPKGVAVAHIGVLRLVSDVDYVELNEQTRVLHLATVSFDAATFEIWGPLLNGGCCVIFPNALPTIANLGRCISAHQVNTLFITTALFNTVIAEKPEIFEPLHTILTGGEAHNLAHMRKALAVLPNTNISNIYGPTECTTFATACRLTLPLDVMPIGKPIANTRVYVLDDKLQCVAQGQEGELYIAGDGVALGYIGQFELTRARFVDQVETPLGGERLYRTGDRVKMLASGDLAFLGRTDDQVKVKGFRIELAEIKTELESLDTVMSAHVLASAVDGNEKRLIAFLLLNKSIDTGELNKALKQRLPHYMIPSQYVVLTDMPLNKNGKVDKAALLSKYRDTAK